MSCQRCGLCCRNVTFTARMAKHKPVPGPGFPIPDWRAWTMGIVYRRKPRGKLGDGESELMGNAKWSST